MFKQKKNKPFEIFLEEVFFVQPSDKCEYTNLKLDFDKEFKTTFPVTTRILSKATQTGVKINNVNYVLFSWLNIENKICGWLCDVDKEEIPNYLCNSHKIFSKNIGGIKETLNWPEDFETFTQNQNFLFIPKYCSQGMKDRVEFYLEVCEEEKCTPIKTNDLIAFVEEANGDIIVYNSNEEVMLFAHDESYDTSEPIDGQPEVTFYKFNNAKNFIEFVEETSSQWERWIKK